MFLWYFKASLVHIDQYMRVHEHRLDERKYEIVPGLRKFAEFFSFFRKKTGRDVGKMYTYWL